METNISDEDQSVQVDHMADGEFSNSSALGATYKIRDNIHICNLHILSCYTSPGQDVELNLDFADNIQACYLARATVIMSERRPDDSRIQVS